MPRAMIELDYANVLTPVVGLVHGLSPAEIKRAAPPVGDVVARIERERKQGAHRYRDLPADRVMLKKIRQMVTRHRLGCESLVVLGIGGSALGSIALQTALSPPFHNAMPTAKRRGPKLFVMDNVDPVQFGGLIDRLGPDLRKTKFNVISKSGETAETAAQFLIVREMLRKKLGSKAPSRQIIVTTDARSGTLREIVEKDGYDALEVPDGVGGRFSVLSAVGLFAAGMCGADLARLLGGATEMSERAATRSVRKNPAGMLALLLHAFYVRGKRLHVMMPYSYQLKDLADWFRQLWAESLGKQVDTEGRPVVVGPTPIKALGVTDQHSQVQLYREGPNDKVFIFLEVERFGSDVKIPRGAGVPEALTYLQGASLGKLLNAEKLATEYALAESGRPSLTIRFPRINAATVGQFIMLWEAATTIMGGLLNINPYDQPAVQTGKDMTYALMGRGGFQKRSEKVERFAKRRGKFVV